MGVEPQVKRMQKGLPLKVFGHRFSKVFPSPGFYTSDSLHYLDWENVMNHQQGVKLYDKDWEYINLDNHLNDIW